MTPQNQFLVSFACIVAGHVVLYKWGDRLHRFAGAMLLTAAWAFSSGAGFQQFAQVKEMMHSRLDAAEPGVRMADQMSVAPPKWAVETSAGVLSFTGAKIEEPSQRPAKPNVSW